MAMTGMVFDVVGQILVRLDVEDLIRCKRVCKSWYSLISSVFFVKLHLNYSNNKDRKLLGHRRIARPTKLPEDKFSYYFACSIVGSSNGLVCLIDYERLLVTNPLTAELKIVLLPQHIPALSLPGISYKYCYGFGYDSYIDDYKPIVGVMEAWISPRERYDVPTSFHVFTLNGSSADWRLIGQVNYGYTESGWAAVLCDGALHWFMRSYQNNRKVILSLDLSTEEFKEIPQPELDEYECNDDHRLGVIQGCLCIYNHQSSSSNKWLYNKQQSWELLPCDYEIENVVHYLRTPGDYTPMDNGCHGICNSTAWDFVRAPIFVQTLVSPHANNSNMGTTRQRTKNEVRPTQTRNNKRSTKRRSYRYVYAKPFHFSHFSQTIYEWKRMRWNSQLITLRIRSEKKRRNEIHNRWLGEY